MGPIIIFDKSLIQSLSLDESVWLDNYFLNNVVPLFYVETLADLSLGKGNDGRPIETIISELAEKTPSNGVPNVHHQRLIIGDLLGHRVEMSGRPVITGSIPKIAPDGTIGFHYSEPPEALALKRWQNKEYLAVEKEFANDWRKALVDLNFDHYISQAKTILPADRKLSSSGEIKSFVDTFVKGKYKQLIYLALDILMVPEQFRSTIVKRWQSSWVQFDDFAPYAAYVLKIDLFFYISLLLGFESKGRKSHKVDLSYLYYLPFCHAFVSNDKLHKRIAPLFMEHNQMFIFGDDLKSGLRVINDHFSKLPDNIKDLGTMKFAIYPPKTVKTIIHDCWDKFCPAWRKHAYEREKESDANLPSDQELLERLKNVQENSKTIELPPQFTSDRANHFIIERNIKSRKGNWRILPVEVEEAARKRLSRS